MLQMDINCNVVTVVNFNVIMHIFFRYRFCAHKLHIGVTILVQLLSQLLFYDLFLQLLEDPPSPAVHCIEVGI